MSRPIIIAEGLSKAYRLGAASRHLPSFREAMTNALKEPFRRIRRLATDVDAASEESFWALRDVDLEIHNGEVIGIIGRNGSGKSTLLKILSRITEPTAGVARLRGRVASMLEVGTGFHPELTGRENIYLSGSIMGMRKSEIDRRFDEIVEFAEIARFLDTPVKHYSSGMFVRLGFSIAAHLDPEILIIDEVLAVGDAAFQRRCLGKMGEVTKGGRTVLFVSHNMAAVRSLCTRCYHLSAGRVVFVGPAHEGVASYNRLAMPPGLESRVTRRLDPPGPDVPWIRSAALRSDGDLADSFGSGSELTLAVEFASPYPMRYPKLRFIVIDDQGNRVLHGDNRHQPGEELEAACTEGTLHCDLGMVPLMPGRYSITLSFGDHAFDTHVEENALEFEVFERDVFGMGPIPSRIGTSLWWPTQFAFGPATVGAATA